MANLSQASIPAGFLKSAAQFGVAESDFLLLADLGIDTHEAFALRVHSREALEEFLRDVICPGAAYRDPVRGLLTFNRTPAVPWQNFKMSEDSAALRKFLLLAKELCKGELEHLAAGQDASRVKVKLASAVAMETPRSREECRGQAPTLSVHPCSASRAWLAATMGRELPRTMWSGRNYISQEEEDKLVRAGSMPKSKSEIILSKDSNLSLKEEESTTPPGSTVGDIEIMRRRSQGRRDAPDRILCGVPHFA